MHKIGRTIETLQKEKEANILSLRAKIVDSKLTGSQGKRGNYVNNNSRRQKRANIAAHQRNISRNTTSNFSFLLYYSMCFVLYYSMCSIFSDYSTCSISQTSFSSCHASDTRLDTKCSSTNRTSYLLLQM